MTLTTDAVHDLIRAVFSLPAEFKFSPGLRPAFVPGWDSFGWMRMILAIEEIVAHEVPLTLFDRVVTVEDFCEAVVEFASQGNEAAQ